MTNLHLPSLIAQAPSLYNEPMFTGIVQTTGKILASDLTPFGRRLSVERAGLKSPITPGDSICCSGVCLTAVEITDTTLGFDVIQETLLKTKIGDLAVGDSLNLEPAVTPSQPLGGHFMQGHVDGLAVVQAIHQDAGECRITFAPESAYAGLMDYIIPRGSVAIDGVSLTLARVGEGTFDVALIPTTLEETTLSKLVPGARVNIEADIISKTIVHQMMRMRDGASDIAGEKPDLNEALRDAGFMK